MEIDKRIETLEQEFKLMKGELKQTLSSVRDYLANTKLMPSEYASLLAGMGGGDAQQVIMKADMSLASGASLLKSLISQPAGEPAAEAQPAGEPAAEAQPASEPAAEAGPARVLFTRAQPAGEELNTQAMAYDEYLAMEPGLTEQPMEYGELDDLRDERLRETGSRRNLREEVRQSAPPVNLLANLIRWVSNAKKEIGSEQLATFLEIYGISGHLSPELKEVILHLMEITEQQETDANAAEIWSQLTLELHGILMGGDAPLHLVKPLWNNDENETLPDETEAETDKPKHKPLKLKLVFPADDGTEREFNIDLSSEAGMENSSEHSSKL